MDNKEELKASTGISIDETFKEETIKEKSLFVKIFIHSWLKYVGAIFVSIVIILIVLSSFDDPLAHPAIDNANAADNNNFNPFFIFLFPFFFYYNTTNKKLVLYTKDELPRVTTLI